MPFQAFYEKFRELAVKETRNITILDGYPTLPADEYGLVEFYCNEENCDCRRVIFNVLSKKRNEFVAAIGYGWESADFYREWTIQDDPEFIKDLQGPVLNPLSYQSKLAPALLELMQELVLKDPIYVARLARHYRMFKERTDPKHFWKSVSTEKTANLESKPKKRHRRR